VMRARGTPRTYREGEAATGSERLQLRPPSRVTSSSVVAPESSSQAVRASEAFRSNSRDATRVPEAPLTVTGTVVCAGTPEALRLTKLVPPFSVTHTRRPSLV